MTRQGPRAPVGEHRVPPTFGSGSLQISADAYEAEILGGDDGFEVHVAGVEFGEDGWASSAMAPRCRQATRTGHRPARGARRRGGAVARWRGGAVAVVEDVGQRRAACRPPISFRWASVAWSLAASDPALLTAAVWGWRAAAWRCRPAAGGHRHRVPDASALRRVQRVPAAGPLPQVQPAFASALPQETRFHRRRPTSRPARRCHGTSSSASE